MKTLADLYQSHTGKVSDKWSLYLNEYDRLFTPYRERPISLLEIGVQNGGSLEIWSQFFVNGTKFVGCDINPDCAKLTYDDPRIAVIVGDATTDETQQKIHQQSATFDLIIEDGSHTSGDIVKGFVKYFPALSDGGLFVAEDLHCSYWQEYQGALYYPYSAINFFKKFVDIVNYEHWGLKSKRSDIFVNVGKKYGVDISDNILQGVSSIEFINSMCIITKKNSIENKLGKRCVVGNDELIHPVLENGQNANINSIDQTGSYWSCLESSPLELHENLVNDLKKNQLNIDALAKELVAVKQSTSWKITTPIRLLEVLVKKIWG